jgi:HAD superfamily hydrolase (TIGR01509 family)
MNGGGGKLSAGASRVSVGRPWAMPATPPRNVVSGEIGVVKPDPAIFRVLVDTYRLDAGECLFIDDSPLNVAAASTFGMSGGVLYLRRGPGAAAGGLL